MVEKTELCSEQDVSEASLNEICVLYLILYCSCILRSEAKGGGFLLLSEVTGFHFPMHCELSPLLGQAQLPAVPLSLHHWFLSRSKIMSIPQSPSLMLHSVLLSPVPLPPGNTAGACLPWVRPLSLPSLSHEAPSSTLDLRHSFHRPSTVPALAWPPAVKGAFSNWSWGLESCGVSPTLS